MEALIGVWLLGIVVGLLAMRVRAGAGLFYGLGAFDPEWVVRIVAAAVIWPITLVAWVVRGRPEPRVLFGRKAAERRAAMERGGR